MSHTSLTNSLFCSFYRDAVVLDVRLDQATHAVAVSQLVTSQEYEDSGGKTEKVKVFGSPLPFENEYSFTGSAPIVLKRGMMIPGLFEASFWPWLGEKEPQLCSESKLPLAQLIMRRPPGVVAHCVEIEVDLAGCYAEYALVAGHTLIDSQHEYGGFPGQRKHLSALCDQLGKSNCCSE